MHLTYKLIWKEKSRSLLAPSKPSKALPCGLSTCLSKKNRSKASLVRSFIQRRQEELTHPWQHWEWIQKGLLKLGVHPSTKTRDQRGDPLTKKQDIEHPFLFCFPKCFETQQIIQKNTTAKVILVLSCVHDRRTYNKFKCDFQPKLVPIGIPTSRKQFRSFLTLPRVQTILFYPSTQEC